MAAVDLQGDICAPKQPVDESVLIRIGLGLNCFDVRNAVCLRRWNNWPEKFHHRSDWGPDSSALFLVLSKEGWRGLEKTEFESAIDAIDATSQMKGSQSVDERDKLEN